MGEIDSLLNSAVLQSSYAMLYDKVFFANGHDNLRKWDLQTISDMIIKAPTTTPGTSSSGTAEIERAKYRVAYGNKWGEQSSLGTETANYVVIYADANGDRQDVSLTSVPVSSDATVTKRFIYRKVEAGRIEKYWESVFDWKYGPTGLLLFSGTQDGYARAGSPQPSNSERLIKIYKGRRGSYRFVVKSNYSSDWTQIGTIEDNSTTTFTDDVSTTSAIGNPIYPPNLLTNRPSFPYITAHRGRIFGWGGVDYSTGTVTVVNGDETVVGSGTDWQEGMAGRKMTIDDVIYIVDSVTDITHLELTIVYAGSNDSGLSYKMTADKNTCWWSEVGKPGEILAKNFVEVDADDGDYGTAIKTLNGRVMLYKRRHIYVLDYLTDPGIGQIINVSDTVGAINDKSVVDVEGIHYILSDDGIYMTSGGRPRNISKRIKDLFPLMDKSKAVLFHAVHHKKRNSIIFFYVKTGDSYPKNAFVYYPDSDEFELREYVQRITASVNMEDENGEPRTYFGVHTADGSYAGEGWIMADDIGYSDGGDTAQGVFGTLTNPNTAGNTGLADAIAGFKTDGNGLDGVVVRMLTGEDAGSEYVIVSNTVAILTIGSGLNNDVAAGDAYVVGPIDMSWLSKKFNFGEPSRKKRLRWIEMSFAPSSNAQDFLLELFMDNGTTAFSTFEAKSQEDGVTFTLDDSEIDIDGDFSTGIIHIGIGAEFDYSLQLRVKVKGVQDALEIQQVVMDWEYAEPASA